MAVFQLYLRGFKGLFKSLTVNLVDLEGTLKPSRLTPGLDPSRLHVQVGEDDHDSLRPSGSGRGGGTGSAEAAPGHLGCNIGALKMTYIILGVPYYVYSIIYPKTLF